MFYRKKTHKSSCGYDAAMMLLANSFHIEDYIYDSVPSGPASFLDILTFLKAKGVVAKAIKISSIRQLEPNFWYIAHQPEGNGHFVTIKSRLNRRFIILDPDLGIYALTSDQLMAAIDGNIIFIQSGQKVKKTKREPLKRKNVLPFLLTIFLQLSTLTALATALYLVNDGSDYLVSIGLLFLAILFYLYEKIYRTHNLFTHIEEGKYAHFTKYIRDSTRKNNFLFQVIAKITSIILSLGLIIYNSLFLGLISIFVFFLLTVLLINYYQPGQIILDIKKIEQQMEKNDKINLLQIKQLQRKAELLTLKKTIAALAKEIIPLLIVILMLIVENKARLNYALFYFFLVRFALYELLQLIYWLRKNDDYFNKTI
ncbi:MAG: cysteine peptidase family C39 domain-containing protein [Bacilli bacterium]|jgi:hypothetical protein|nr:cysteine peptidase family C39 domain-containing protein [Bacilli bacterium]MCH4236057.1 cysteine peptidase family C39 domain-containing protein [Bacilli bacterium]